jgi:hypothetical protein
MPICDALARNPQTLEQLAELPALKGRSFEDVVQLAALLVASKQAVLYGPGGAEHDSGVAKRMNLAVAAKTRYTDEFRSLCSGMTGGALSVAFVARLVYWLIVEKRIDADEQALTQAGWPLMKAQGRHMVKDGIRLEDELASQAELQSHIAAVLREQLPIWRKLNML